MTLSAFSDPKTPPSDTALHCALGTTASLWTDTTTELKASYSPLTSEWKQYGKASGWLLVCKQKKRTIVYLCPQSGAFLAVVVLGEKAATAALESKLPAAIKSLIREARPYAEGRSIRLPVTTAADVLQLRSLIGFKMA